MRRAVAVVLLVFSAFACTSPPTRDPAVVEDVLQYIAKIKKWEPIEAKAITAIKDVQRSQYVDDEYVVATLGAVMDDMQIHLTEIGAYRPMTKPVTEVHDGHVQAPIAQHLARFQAQEASTQHHGVVTSTRCSGIRSNATRMSAG